MSIKFSFVIPVYNVETYLRKCLDSILVQDYVDWEALLVDDGSTDASGLICDEYVDKDNRFHVFHKPNGGVSTARNMALDNAKGDWIWFVDSDDWIVPNALIVLNNAISRQKKCDLVLFGIKYFNESYAEIGYEKRDNIIGKSKDNTIDLGDYPPQNYLIKRDIVERYNLRFTDGIATGEDLEFQYKYFMLCLNPISIEGILYNCLRREGSAMRNPRTIGNKANDSPRVLNGLVDFIETHKVRESPWLAARLNRTFKSAMSANYVAQRNPSLIQKTITDCDDKLKEIGFRQYRDFAVAAGSFNVRVYNLAQSLRKLLGR